MVIDSSPATPTLLALFFQRNLEEGAIFENTGREYSRVDSPPPGVTEKYWKTCSLDNLPTQAYEHVAFVIRNVREGNVDVFTLRENAILYGYARAGRRRFEIRESADDLKAVIRSRRELIRHLITLHDEYEKDSQLSSGKAKFAQEALLKALYDTGSSTAAAFGNVEFNPHQMAWVEFMDSIGNMDLGQFLGIERPEDIPGNDMEARIDAVTREIDNNSPDPDPDPEKIISSVKKTRGTRLSEYATACVSPALQVYRNHGN